VLLVGVSVRALAESASRAGYAVTAIDGYADLDTAAVATAHQVSPYSAHAVARLARESASDAVCYVSNIENHPSVLRRITRGRTLWGNGPRTLERARDAIALARVMTSAGIPAPRVRQRAPRRSALDPRRQWLIKPRASGGGHGIAHWTADRPIPGGYVLQERMPGTPASILFVSDGRTSRPFAVTRQIIGDRHFGARAFRYCGNLLAAPEDARWGVDSPLGRSAHPIAAIATQAFGLVGVNGIDVIVGRGHVVPIEVNPRYTAAMELAERRDGLSVFAAHVAGSAGRLQTIAFPDPAAGVVGKAIVFARRASRMGDTRRWLRDPDIRDVPRPGTAVPRGAPICTVFAAAPTMAACYQGLVDRAEMVYAAVSS
jgi:predicted ATP-grasp superfamily ATP-dependent carboligase